MATGAAPPKKAPQPAPNIEQTIAHDIGTLTTPKLAPKPAPKPAAPAAPPAGWVEIPNPATGSELTSHGYTSVTVGNHQYYNPDQAGITSPVVLPTPGASTSGQTGIGAAPTGGLTGTQQDAWAQLQNTLAQYGFTGSDLTALVNWAKGEVISGAGTNQIALDLQQTPQFKARFPAIETLANEGVAITPAQYISLEQSYAQLEQQAGLPPNYASFDQLIANQVSPSEYSARIQQGYQAVAMADPTVVQAMQNYYGVTAGQLAAYFLDPTKSEPVLLQQAASAQIGGAAMQAHFGNNGQGLSQPQALRLAQMGVTQSQAQTGFKTLAQQAQLYNPLPGQAHVGNPLSNDQLVNAQFGSDGQTALQLQLQAEFEKGTTAQGTQVATTGQGATGLGAVSR